MLGSRWVVLDNALPSAPPCASIGFSRSAASAPPMSLAADTFARESAARPSVRGTSINAMPVAASATRRAGDGAPLLADDNAGAVRDRMARGQHVAEIVDKERSAVEPLADRRRPGDVTRQRLRRLDLPRRLKRREWHLRRGFVHVKPPRTQPITRPLGQPRSESRPQACPGSSRRGASKPTASLVIQCGPQIDAAARNTPAVSVHASHARPRFLRCGGRAVGLLVSASGRRCQLRSAYSRRTSSRKDVTDPAEVEVMDPFRSSCGGDQPPIPRREVAMTRPERLVAGERVAPQEVCSSGHLRCG